MRRKGKGLEVNREDLGGKGEVFEVKREELKVKREELKGENGGKVTLRKLNEFLKGKKRGPERGKGGN